MKPACVPCQRFFRPKKNNFFFIEGMPIESAASPGVMEPEKWRPYKLWAADLWECEGCGAQILSGYGKQPIAEHYMLTFAGMVAQLSPKVQINDC